MKLDPDLEYYYETFLMLQGGLQALHSAAQECCDWQVPSIRTAFPRHGKQRECVDRAHFLQEIPSLFSKGYWCPLSFFRGQGLRLYRGKFWKYKMKEKRKKLSFFKVMYIVFPGCRVLLDAVHVERYFREKVFGGKQNTSWYALHFSFVLASNDH